MSGSFSDVDFALSADQVALRDAASELLDGRSSIAVVRSAMDRLGRPDPALWTAMVDQGWCGIAVPESLGGIGLGWVEAALLIEAVGAHVAPSPILSQLVALDLLADSEWGPGLLSGEITAAITDDLAAPVPYAPTADVVLAIDGDGLVAMELTDRPAVEAAMDLTRPLGFVGGDRARCTVIGDSDALDRFRDLGSIAYAAELLGLAQRCLDMSVAYAGERVQFGKPIGSFQAIKHRCADMLVDVEGMRSVVVGGMVRAGPSRRRVGGRIDGKDLVLRRRHAGSVRRHAGARRHRLHLGARPAPLPQTHPPRRPGLRRRHVASPAAGHDPP